MSEIRDFIPTGNCVETDAPLFTSPLTVELAKQACGACLQLSYCQEQRGAISAILAQRGEVRPVVGGEVLPENASAVDLSPIEQFGEVTLRFDRHTLPNDGERALRSVQQGVRAGQISIYSLVRMRHPTLIRQSGF